MRKPIIAGNWKMNKTPSEAIELIAALKPLIADNTTTDAVVCPPFCNLTEVKKAIEGSNIKLGAQNMYFEESGAYTGEISPLMLKEIGVEYVILGHSERRQYFGETDENVNKKTHAAIQHDLIPIICVGETLEQRDDGVTDKIVADQTTAALKDVTAADIKNIVVAYEPVWAIGTGKTATAEEANRVIGVIRNAVKELLGQEAADALRIQYGGSMNPKNVAELMAQDEIDGGLIGGAALKAEDFSALINNQ